MKQLKLLLGLGFVFLALGFSGPTLAEEAKPLSEAEIPVLQKVPVAKAEGSDPLARLIISAFVLTGLSIGLVLFSKWYAKRGLQKTDLQKIQLVSQFHLGPKKSLAVIRVSGESILVGITDHNINLIKTLALFDDEIEANGEKYAGTFASKLQNSVGEDQDLSAIRDQVTMTTKGLRPWA